MKFSFFFFLDLKKIEEIYIFMHMKDKNLF